MAKVCANHLARLRHRPLRRLAGLDQAQGDRHRSLLRRRFHRRRRTPRRSCSSDPGGGVYKKLVLKDDKLIGGVLYGDTVDGAWYFKLLRERTQHRRDPRPADVRRGATSATPDTRARSRALAMPDDAEVCGCNGVVQGHDRQGDQGQGPVHARRRAQAHQGVVVVRLVHRPGRAAPDGDRRRRLFGARRSRSRSAAAPTARTRRCATRSASSSLLSIAARDALPRMAHAERLRDLPARAQLLPASRPGRTRRRTTRSRASSTSARTPTSRRTARSRSCRACGAARPTPPSCAASPTSSTSTRFRR